MIRKEIRIEKDLDVCLRNVLTKYGNTYKVDTNVGYGFPDFYFVGEFTCWVEDKIAEKLGDKIKFQAGQPSWLSENNNVANTFILVYYKNENVFYLYSGKDARTLQFNGDVVSPLATFDKRTFKEIYGRLHEFCTRNS